MSIGILQVPARTKHRFRTVCSSSLKIYDVGSGSTWSIWAKLPARSGNETSRSPRTHSISQVAASRECPEKQVSRWTRCWPHGLGSTVIRYQSMRGVLLHLLLVVHNQRPQILHWMVVGVTQYVVQIYLVIGVVGRFRRVVRLLQPSSQQKRRKKREVRTSVLLWGEQQRINPKLDNSTALGILEDRVQSARNNTAILCFMRHRTHQNLLLNWLLQTKILV